MAKKKKKAADAEAFEPFKKFYDNRDLLTKHLTATEISYALTLSSLADPTLIGTKINDPKVVLRKADSFTGADIGVGRVTRRYGWVSLKEYAELEKKDLASVKDDAKAGKLGKVEIHPNKKNEIVFWPIHMQGTNKARSIELGLSSFSVQMKRPITESLDLDTDEPASLPPIRSHLIFLGRTLGDPHGLHPVPKTPS